MNTPCTHKTSCVPCDAVLDTQEAPDEPNFLGLVRIPLVPKLGQTFSALGCVGWCFSTVSQADADLCAIQQAQLCVNPDNNFFSAQKECTVPCAGGSATSVVEAGTVISTVSQADADLRAQSIACDQATLLTCGAGDCETNWFVGDGTFFPPISFSSGSSHFYTNGDTGWDTCFISSHGSGSYVELGVRAATSQWQGRMTLRPFSPSQWKVQVYLIRDRDAAFPTFTEYYPNAADLHFSVNGIDSTFVMSSHALGFERYWVDPLQSSVSGVPGADTISTWLLNISAGELFELEWDFTGIAGANFQRGYVLIQYQGPSV